MKAKSTDKALKPFDPLVTQITEFLAPAKGLAVTDQESKKIVTECCAEIAGLKKRVKAKADELVAPGLEFNRKVYEKKNELIDLLEKADVPLKAELLAYSRKIAEEQRLAAEKLAAEQKAAEEKRDADLKAAAALAPDEATHMSEVSRIHQEADWAASDLAAKGREIKAAGVSGVRKRWTFSIADEALIPREYLVISPVSINAAIMAGVRVIPGLLIFQDESLSVRAKELGHG